MDTGARVERRSLRVFHFGDQRLKVLRARCSPRLGVADHALRHPVFLDARDLRQRLDDLQTRDAHSQFARDELEEDKPFVRGKFVDPLSEAAIPLHVVKHRQRQQPLAHPNVERGLFLRNAAGQKERQRFRQIADAVVAFFDQPVRKPGAFDGEAAQEARRHGLARLAAGEKINDPCRARPAGRIISRCGESIDQRRQFCARRGGGIELTIKICERSHAALSGFAGLSLPALSSSSSP